MSLLKELELEMHFYTSCTSTRLIESMRNLLSSFLQDETISISHVSKIQGKLSETKEHSPFFLFTFQPSNSSLEVKDAKSFKAHCSFVPNKNEKSSLFEPSLLEIAKEVLKLLKITPGDVKSLSRFSENTSKVDWDKSPSNTEFVAWSPQGVIALEKEINLRARVIKGLKRDLGFCTANIKYDDMANELAGVIHGVYFGLAKLEIEEEFHPMAMSVGHNLHFNQESPTIEVYIFHNYSEGFYNEILHVKSISIIRAQSAFFNLNHLLQAIHNDIELCNKHLIPKIQEKSNLERKF